MLSESGFITAFFPTVFGQVIIMDGKLARNLFTRLIRTTKKPDSGPVLLSADDAKSLREVASEIVHSFRNS